MSIAILIFGALMAIIGIWLDYWADAKSIQKLKRKKRVNIISTFFLIIGLILSYIQYGNETKLTNDKLTLELEHYRTMDTVKLLSVDINSISKEAAKSIENIKNLEFEARRSLLAIKDSSHLLVNDMLEQQQRRTKSYIVELKTVSEQLRELSYNIRFSGVSSRMVLSINDSIRKVDEFKSFISQSISLLVSQIQNEYFSSDKNFYQTWILYFNDLTNLRIHLSGYDPYTVLVDWETLVESGSRFINKINGYLMYEPFEKNNKKNPSR